MRAFKRKELSTKSPAELPKGGNIKMLRQKQIKTKEKPNQQRVNQCIKIF